MDNNSLENIVIAEKKEHITLLQSWTKYCRQIHEKSNAGFPIEFFTTDFLQFCSTTVKVLPFGVAGCVLSLEFQRFQVFPSFIRS